MTNEKTITQNLAIIEYYKEQLNSIDLQLQISQAALNDYTKAKLTLEHLQKTEKNDEILIPLGGGTFLKGTILDKNKILTDIGAGVVTEKSITIALQKVVERIQLMQNNRDKLIALAEKLQDEATILSQKTQELMQESQTI
ncbi:MAG: prefoldin subunit alpha [Candidatus Thermoplasmatota archaeon]|nr:prefoldin subunit alpha [Candidatus Thermoplasmatota archaeon]MBU1940735.1 prefoldin subunit alpha [Candidatus Thermoplasmatota archaeon]